MKVFKRILTVVTVFAGFAVPAYAEKVVVAGSTTVLPIAQKAAEVFMDQNSFARITVRGGGSGVGLASLIDGTCDIADSSRPIKDTELDKAVTNGRNIKAHVIAMDGIAIIVNPENRVNALSKQQLKDIYTGKVSNWSQVGGGSGQIVVVSRDTASGTFESFSELALNKEKVRPDALMQASNAAVVSTVDRTPGAIGYVGLGYITSSVKAVEIDGIMPSEETVLADQYAFGRPLFMYTNGEPKGLAKEFIDFLLSSQGQRIVSEEGFVALK